MILTVSQLFGDSSVHPRAKEKAMGYMTELIDLVEADSLTKGETK